MEKRNFVTSLRTGGLSDGEELSESGVRAFGCARRLDKTAGAFQDLSDADEKSDREALGRCPETGVMV